MSEDWPIPGTLLAARYRLVGLLETGGMAEIWRADDELLGRPVAVKLPTGSQVAWREARMAAKLQHPAIAAVHDYREAVRADGTVAPFVVMELLAGETVAAHLTRERFTPPEAARIGAAVADALAAAHAHGVVHRDIKPGNVMLTPNGVKILDFGISAAAGEPDDDDTGATFGTPAYVAPERLDGMPAEPATDVYGLGVLLFEMVTGDPPYPVETWEELAEARASGPHVLPADLPPGFRDLVERCLDEDPAGRPGAEEIRFDLTALWLSERSGPGASAETSPTPEGESSSPDAASPSSAAPPSAAPPSAAPVSAAPPSAAPASAAPSGYAAGRAPAKGRAAATIALTAPPKRKLALSLTLLVLAMAIGGTIALINRRPDRTIDARPAPPAPSAPVTASLLPPPTAEPKSAAPTTRSASPRPKPSPTLTFADAVVRMRTAVQDGAAVGEIRDDVATDLLNLLQPLNGAQGKNVGDQVGQLRRKIRERAGEGSVSESRAAVLQSRLSDLDRASGT